VVIKSAEIRELHGEGARGGVDPEVGVDAGGFELHPAQAGGSGEPRSGDVAEDNVRGCESDVFFSLGKIGPESNGVR